MENYLKNKKNIITICIIITLIIITILIYILYNNWQKNENIKNFYNYLEKNNYQKDEQGIYTKRITENNKTTTVKALLNNYVFEKNITENNDNYTSLNLFYKKDKTIEIMYQVEGYDQDNKYGILFQKGNLKNGNFTCEIITNQNFKTQCKYMKNEAIKYEKEINKILKTNNINIKKIEIE